MDVIEQFVEEVPFVRHAEFGDVTLDDEKLRTPCLCLSNGCLGTSKWIGLDPVGFSKLVDQSEAVSPEVKVADRCDLCDRRTGKRVERGHLVLRDRSAVDLHVDCRLGTSNETFDVDRSAGTDVAEFDRVRTAAVMDLATQAATGEAAPRELHHRVLHCEDLGW